MPKGASESDWIDPITSTELATFPSFLIFVVSLSLHYMYGGTSLLKMELGNRTIVDMAGPSLIHPDSLFFIALAELVDRLPMLFLDEIQRIIEQCTGYRYSLSQIQEAITRQGYTHHKVLEYRAMEQNHNLRTLYQANMMLNYTASQLVYFDETHSQAKDFRRRYGYGIRGLPAFANVRNLAHGKGKSAAAACALALDGMMAVRVTEGKMNADYITAFIIEDVIPEMTAFPGPKSVLVMDNASVHEVDQIANLLQARGMILILLPPYSYDFNPIEFSFHEAEAEILCREYGVCMTLKIMGKYQLIDFSQR